MRSMGAMEVRDARKYPIETPDVSCVLVDEVAQHTGILDVKIGAAAARCTQCQSPCGRLVRAVVDPFVALKRAGGDGVEVMLQDFAPELPTSQRSCRR